MKILVVDLDETIALRVNKEPYIKCKPNIPLIKKLTEYKKNGFKICIYSSRNMRTYNSNIGLINKNTLPEILNWLNMHNVPYDEVLIGKPWCGFDGFYIDDKAIRPSEFIDYSYDEINYLIGRRKKSTGMPVDE